MHPFNQFCPIAFIHFFLYFSFNGLLEIFRHFFYYISDSFNNFLIYFFIIRNFDNIRNLGNPCLFLLDLSGKDADVLIYDLTLISLFDQLFFKRVYSIDGKFLYFGQLT